MKYFFDSVTAVVGTAITYLIGQWDAPLIVLLCFMAADYITGVLAAIVSKKLSSSIGFKGLAKKSCILLILIVAVLLDHLLNGDEWLFRTLCAYFYIANEGISIIENAALLGIPVPQKLVDILTQLNNDPDGE